MEQVKKRKKKKKEGGETKKNAKEWKSLRGRKKKVLYERLKRWERKKKCKDRRKDFLSKDNEKYGKHEKKDVYKKRGKENEWRKTLGTRSCRNEKTKR